MTDNNTVYSLVITMEDIYSKETKITEVFNSAEYSINFACKHIINELINKIQNYPLLANYIVWIYELRFTEDGLYFKENRTFSDSTIFNFTFYRNDVLNPFYIEIKTEHKDNLELKSVIDAINNIKRKSRKIKILYS